MNNISARDVKKILKNYKIGELKSFKELPSEFIEGKPILEDL